MTLAPLPSPIFTGADLSARVNAATTELRGGARQFATVAALLADTTMAYTSGSRAVTAGDAVTVPGQGLAYQVALVTATDHHITTAGGVNLYVRAALAVSPLAFGAVANGVADDTVPVRAAHAYANSAGLPVSYAGITSLAIQANAQIVVNTSVDFAGCRVVPLAGIVGTPSETAPLVMFRAYDAATPVVTGTVAVTAANLRDDSMTPTADFFQGPGFAYLQGSGGAGQMIAGRNDGDAALAYRQSFAVGRNAQVNHPPSVDASGWTSVYYRTRAMSAAGRIALSGLRFDPSLCNNQVVIQVERNAVTIRDLTFLPPTGAYATDTVHRLINILDAALVTIEDITATAQYTASVSGTYLIRASRSAEVHLSRVFALNGWGQMASDDINGLYVTDCTLNRVDAHSGGHNIFVTGGALQDNGVSYGWGGGVISVKGTRLVDGPAIQARSDYGGYFWGSFVVEGITVVSDPFTSTIVDLGAYPVGRTAMAVPAPRSITVRGVVRSTLDGNGNNREIIPVHLLVDPTSMGVTAPASITVSDIEASGNWRYRVIVDYANMVLDATQTDRARLTLRNLPASRGPSSTDGGVYVPPNAISGAGAAFDLNASGCLFLDVNTASHNANARHYLTDCHIVSLRTPSTCGAHVVGGRFGTARLVGAETLSPVGGAAAASSADRTTLIGARIEAANWDLSRCHALGGVMIPSTVTPTLPSGVTKAAAFTGWQASGF